MKFLNKIPLAFLVGLTLPVILGMLYFGIRFKGYRPANNVTWLPSEQGLAFDRYAIAYTDDFFPIDPSGDNGGLTIEMALRCKQMTHSEFCYVLCVNDGDEQRQLLIGQWRHWLTVMNGDDYDGSAGVGKIYVDIAGMNSDPMFLTISAGPQGTAVYLNGVRVKSNSRLRLFFPSRPKRKTRLILGNSTRGTMSWKGVIAKLAVYDTALSASHVGANYQRWTAGENPAALPGAAAPRIDYRFYPEQTATVRNRADDAYHLQVPVFMTILEKKFLAWPDMQHQGKRSMAKDMLLNLLGFIPLGFLTGIVLGRLETFSRRGGWLAAIGLAFGFSLFLEIVQAWIPSRDSSMLDLLLNTLGAAMGVMALSFYDKMSPSDLAP